MGSMSIAHWMIVIGVVVLLFGRNKISGLMGDVAQGIKSFKKGMQEDEPTAATHVQKPPDRDAPPSILPVPASQQIAEKV